MILKALSLGFSSGIFCLGYCYPILAPILLSKETAERKRSFKSSALSLGLFLAGRLVAYALFGVLTGILGAYTKRVAFIHVYILPALFLLLGSAMVFYGISQKLPHWGLCRLTNRYIGDARFLLLAGFLAGINLCPPFLLGLSYALSIGDVGRTVLFFLFFFLATSVFLLPFIFSSLLSSFESVRKAARVTAVAAGIWFIYLAVKGWVGH